MNLESNGTIPSSLQITILEIFKKAQGMSIFTKNVPKKLSGGERELDEASHGHSAVFFGPKYPFGGRKSYLRRWLYFDPNLRTGLRLVTPLNSMICSVESDGCHSLFLPWLRLFLM